METIHGGSAGEYDSSSLGSAVMRGETRCLVCITGRFSRVYPFWAALNKMTVYKAAVDLCQQAGVEVPWIERW